jgi:hypothetical protein
MPSVGNALLIGAVSCELDADPGLVEPPCA